MCIRDRIWLLAYNDLKGDLSELQSMLDTPVVEHGQRGQGLAALYTRHLQPSFDDADTTQLEHDIRVASHRVTQLLHASEQNLRALCAPHAAPRPRDGPDVVLTIRRNLQKRFATPPQDPSART